MKSINAFKLRMLLCDLHGLSCLFACHPGTGVDYTIVFMLLSILIGDDWLLDCVCSSSYHMKGLTLAK